MPKSRVMNKSKSNKINSAKTSSLSKNGKPPLPEAKKKLTKSGLTNPLENEHISKLAIPKSAVSEDNILIEPGAIIKVFKASPEAMVIFDARGIIYDCNNPCLRLLGFTADDTLKGKNILDLIAKSDRHLIKKDNYFIFEKTEQNTECSLVDKNGKKINTEISFSTLKDNDNNPLFHAIIIKDISYRKEHEKKIKELIKFYDNILESFYSGVCVTDSEDNIIYVNNAVKTFINVKPVFVYNKNIRILLHKYLLFDLENCYRESKNTLKTGTFDSMPININRDKISYQSGWFIPILKNKSFDGMICICYDVTTHKISEDTLAKERNLFSALIENIPFFVYIKDKNGKFLHCNKTVADFWGTTPPKNDRKNLIMTLCLKKMLINTSLKNNGLFRQEFPYWIGKTLFPMQPGLRGWSSYTKVPYTDTDGNIAGLIGLNRDVTGSKRVTEDLQILLNISNGPSAGKKHFLISEKIFFPLLKLMVI